MVRSARKPISEMSEAQREGYRASKKKYHDKNRERITAKKREHYQKNRLKYLTLERDRQYRKRYGITLADYDAMLSAQDGKCQICKAEKAGNAGQAFAVDHCHKTLKVRGLLCIKCNARLGWFERYRESVSQYLGADSA